MAGFVAFTTLDGTAIEVNAFDDAIASLVAVPQSVLDGLLPTVVAAATYIEWTSGRKIAVQGSVATTAAALTAGSYVTPAQLPDVIWLFVGAVTGVGAGTTEVTFAGSTGLLTSIAPGGWTYPITARRFTGMTVVMTGGSTGGNPLTTALDLTVKKNGVATALTISATALVLGTYTLSANVDFADGDVLTVTGANTNGGVGNVRAVIVLRQAPLKP